MLADRLGRLRKTERRLPAFSEGLLISYPATVAAKDVLTPKATLRHRPVRRRHFCPLLGSF